MAKKLRSRSGRDDSDDVGDVDEGGGVIFSVGAAAIVVIGLLLAIFRRSRTAIDEAISPCILPELLSSEH